MEKSFDVVVTGTGEAGAAAAPFAEYEGEPAARNVIEGNQHPAELSGVASVVHSIPPLGAVGLTEDQARARGLDFAVKQTRLLRLVLRAPGCKHARRRPAADAVRLPGPCLQHGVDALKVTMVVGPHRMAGRVSRRCGRRKLEKG